MNFLFSKKKENALSLILDIQSGLVRGALVSFKKASKPHIIFVYSKHINNSVRDNGLYITKIMTKALHDVVSLIGKEGIARAKEIGLNDCYVDKVYYGLSAPWALSQAKKISIKTETECVVTQKSIREIVDKESKILVSNFIKGIKDTEGNSNDLITIEEKIFDIKLNGYSVADFKGKKTNNLDISFAMTIASKKILRKISDEVLKTFHVKKEYYNGSLLLHYLALRNLCPGNDEYISVHAHGELTDIVVVNKGSLIYLSSFRFGAYTLSRKIAKAMRTTTEAVDSLLSMYSDGKLDKRESERLEKILGPILDHWKTSLTKELEEIGKMNIPHIVCLSVHDYFLIFKKAVIESGFEVIQFDNSLVDEAVTFEKHNERSWLMGMYAVSIEHVNKNKNISNDVLK